MFVTGGTGKSYLQPFDFFLEAAFRKTKWLLRLLWFISTLICVYLPTRLRMKWKMAYKVWNARTSSSIELWASCHTYEERLLKSKLFANNLLANTLQNNKFCSIRNLRSTQKTNIIKSEQLKAGTFLHNRSNMKRSIPTKTLENSIANKSSGRTHCPAVQH